MSLGLTKSKILKLFPFMEVGATNDAERFSFVDNALKNVRSGSRVLDAGAGELRFKPLCKNFEYVAQDFGQYDGIGDDSGLQTGKWDSSKLDLVCDITSIPEPDESFDVILCSEVLEHLPDPNNALRELSRLLKPDGQLIITAPFCSLTHFAPFHFYSGFNKYFYESLFPKFGLKIVKMEKNGNFFEFLGQEMRRLRSTALKYSKKRFRWYEYLGVAIVLKALHRFSKADGGSSEILFFGTGVIARKEL
jgi:ubiquinone/menaquinone biosynthesis C-methylase UbiE